jgi:hypothetical protein
MILGYLKLIFQFEQEISEGIDGIDSSNLEYNIKETFYDDIQPDELDSFFDLADSSRLMLKLIQPRTRQNEIFELGITMGIFHRDNVRVMYEEGVELPTDILGHAYTVLDDKWKENIGEELKAISIL